MLESVAVRHKHFEACLHFHLPRESTVLAYYSVAARLGKGQGAKEIGHNLVHERPKFGNNLARKRHKIGHNLERKRPSEARFYARTPTIRAQSSTRTKRGRGTILWAIDENMGTNLQAFYKHFYIGCLEKKKRQLHFVKKIFFFFKFGQGAV